VGITAFAQDQDVSDTVSDTLDDDADGRFAIDAATGVVTVAGAIDREEAASYDIAVRATSTDGSFSTHTFTIEIGDVSDFDVSAISDVDAEPDYVLENAPIGTLVGITAFAQDQDATATVTYTLDDDADGRFAIHPTTGVVTLAGAIDYETATSHTIVVRATSTDGSSVICPLDIAIGDEVEGDTGGEGNGEGEGEGEASAYLLVDGTPADGHRATDLVMAEAPTAFPTDDFEIDLLPSDVDYAEIVDEIVADLFGAPSLL
jgi:hypothetical protein